MSAAFQNPFFYRHPLRNTLTIRNHLDADRSYAFPTYFAQTRALHMVFTAETRVCQELVAETQMHPVEVAPGRALFAVAWYRYGQISDGMIGYNEVAMGVLVSASRLPIVPLITRSFSDNFGIFIVDLPVDSEENCNRGVAIWGLPKTMKTFEETTTQAERHIRVLDGKDLCLELTSPMAGRRMHVAEKTTAYSLKDGALLRASTYTDGACWQFTQMSKHAAGVSVRFGSHSTYANLRRLGLSEKPLLVRSYDALSSILYAPEPATLVR